MPAKRRGSRRQDERRSRRTTTSSAASATASPRSETSCATTGVALEAEQLRPAARGAARARARASTAAARIRRNMVTRAYHDSVAQRRAHLVPRLAGCPASICTRTRSVSDGTETPGGAGRARPSRPSSTSSRSPTTTRPPAGSSAFVAGRGTGHRPSCPASNSARSSTTRACTCSATCSIPTNPALVAETARIREERLHRAEAMVARIAADYALDWDDVLAQTTPGATVGRPHIADALVARGHRAGSIGGVRRASCTGGAATTARTTRRHPSTASA